MASEIWAQQVGVDVGSRTILEGAELKVAAGETVVVTGPSGSGKTTLMLVMAGLQDPDRGQVLLDGDPISGRDDLRLRFGVVLQNHGLVSVLTAAENVAIALQARGLGRGEVADRTQDMLVALGLRDSVNRLVRDLSGGQRQRVGVARALVGEPEVVLADEPTSELDSERRALVLNLMRDHAAKGNIVILASHDQVVADAAGRTLDLVDGRPRGS
ncbi:MAG TPA: ATP-binding cassette domain-containing protein [Candidatus Dormibacteraeota bacterium]|nr:ATP-binding cassette domain-containing protein [Candidatus Dormibacteraeota bacterium]